MSWGKVLARGKPGEGDSALVQLVRFHYLSLSRSDGEHGPTGRKSTRNLRNLAPSAFDCGNDSILIFVMSLFEVVPAFIQRVPPIKESVHLANFILHHFVDLRHRFDKLLCRAHNLRHTDGLQMFLPWKC